MLFTGEKSDANVKPKKVSPVKKKAGPKKRPLEPKEKKTSQTTQRASSRRNAATSFKSQETEFSGSDLESSGEKQPDTLSPLISDESLEITSSHKETKTIPSNQDCEGDKFATVKTGGTVTDSSYDTSQTIEEKSNEGSITKNTRDAVSPLNVVSDESLEITSSNNETKTLPSNQDCEGEKFATVNTEDTVTDSSYDTCQTIEEKSNESSTTKNPRDALSPLDVVTEKSLEITLSNKGKKTVPSEQDYEGENLITGSTGDTVTDPSYDTSQAIEENSSDGSIAKSTSEMAEVESAMIMINDFINESDESVDMAADLESLKTIKVENILAESMELLSDTVKGDENISATSTATTLVEENVSFSSCKPLDEIRHESETLTIESQTKLLQSTKSEYFQSEESSQLKKENNPFQMKIENVDVNDWQRPQTPDKAYESTNDTVSLENDGGFLKREPIKDDLDFMETKDTAIENSMIVDVRNFEAAETSDDNVSSQEVKFSASEEFVLLSGKDFNLMRTQDMKIEKNTTVNGENLEAAEKSHDYISSQEVKFSASEELLQSSGTQNAAGEGNLKNLSLFSEKESISEAVQENNSMEIDPCSTGTHTALITGKVSVLINTFK